MRLLNSFALAGFIPPSVANIEAESNFTACRDEDEKGPGRISIS